MSGLFGSSDQTTTQISNPYEGLPGWVTDYYKRDVDRGEGLVDSAGAIAEDRAYDPGQIVGMHPDEIAAIEAMMGENQQAQGLMDDAVGALGGERYMSDYTDDVVDTTLAGMDRNYAREIAQRNASSAGVGGMSNTRAGVADALAGQLHGMDRAEMEAKLRDSGFRFGSEMGLQESDALGALAGGGMDLQSTASQWQGTGGETARGIEQQREDLPEDTLNWYANLFNSSRGLPATGGGTTTGTEPGPSMASQILGGASTAAGIWTGLGLSDERAKDEIAPERDALGKLRGVDTYSYKYRDGLGHTPERTTGLMAQDLERAGITGSVIEGDDGLKRVDFYPVLATVVQAVRELDNRTSSQGL